MTDVLIKRELLADLLSDDRERRIHAERTLYSIPANPTQQGEAVEVVAWQDAENPLYTTAERRVMQEWANNQYPIVELMTVAQHQRILAASVPAGCEVVPVELLERVLYVMDNYVTHETPEEEELRALLASAEGVKDE